MNDDDLLRGYRPPGPPADLRARILSASAPWSAKASAERSSLLDWLPATAAVVLIVLLRVLAAGILDRVYDQVAGTDVPTQVEAPLQ